MDTHANGFTLVEMLMVMALMAVTTALALPSFNHVLERQRTGTTIHLMTTALSSARHAAIKHARPTQLCPATDNGRCIDSSDWSQAISLHLLDNSGSPVADPLLATAFPAPESIRIISSAGRKTVRFQADGRAAGSNIKLHVCTRGRVVGEITVNNWGRIRSASTPGTQTCPST